MRTLRTVLGLLVVMTSLLAADDQARAIAAPTAPAVVQRPNILVVVADDVGVDMLSVYGEGFASACSLSGLECQVDSDCPGEETCQPNFPPTPTIDRLATTGILFRNAWAYPTCSPMRAAVNTGRYGFRTGVGFAFTELPLSETVIPEALDANPWNVYAHAAIGKWHLGGGAPGPNNHGYSHFAGTVANLNNYFSWPRTENGVTQTVTTYATTTNVDDALAWIDHQKTPWFLWLAFNAPHSAFHAPPDDLHSYHGVVRPRLPVAAGQSCASLTNRERRLCYSAMLEALDTELGRLLNALPRSVRNRTTIIFVGDNGTPAEITAPPFNPSHAKFTVYEGGINVPLIISGANVVKPRRESAALVDATDVFATVLRLAGVTDISTVIPPDVTIDSVSLWPIIRNRSRSVRAYAFSEQFRQFPALDDGHTIRNVRGFKLILFPNRPGNLFEFYDLEVDPWETTDLYDDEDPMLNHEQQANFDDLLIQLYRLWGL